MQKKTHQQKDLSHTGNYTDGLLTVHENGAERMKKKIILFHDQKVVEMRDKWIFVNRE